MGYIAEVGTASGPWGYTGNLLTLEELGKTSLDRICKCFLHTLVLKTQHFGCPGAIVCRSGLEETFAEGLVRVALGEVAVLQFRILLSELGVSDDLSSMLTRRTSLANSLSATRRNRSPPAFGVVRESTFASATVQVSGIQASPTISVMDKGMVFQPALVLGRWPDQPRSYHLHGPNQIIPKVRGSADQTTWQSDDTVEIGLLSFEKVPERAF